MTKTNAMRIWKIKTSKADTVPVWYGFAKGDVETLKEKIRVWFYDRERGDSLSFSTFYAENKDFVKGLHDYTFDASGMVQYKD